MRSTGRIETTVLPRQSYWYIQHAKQSTDYIMQTCTNLIDAKFQNMISAAASEMSVFLIFLMEGRDYTGYSRDQQKTNESISYIISLRAA